METIKLNGTTFVIEKGLSQAIINSFLKGGDVVVKKHCKKCGFVLGQYTGRYPTDCPVCGDPFEKEDVSIESFGAYHEDKCIAILTKAPSDESIAEGAMSDADIDITEFVDAVIAKVKDGSIKSKQDLNNVLKNVKAGKTLPNVKFDNDVIRDNFSDVVKRIGKRLKKENVKLK